MQGNSPWRLWAVLNRREIAGVEKDFNFSKLLSNFNLKLEIEKI